MASRIEERPSARRDLLRSAVAVTGAAAAASVFGGSSAWGADKKVHHKSLDPVNPDERELVPTAVKRC